MQKVKMMTLYYQLQIQLIIKKFGSLNYLFIFIIIII